ncbi:MAG: hypothetical protein ACD_78C00452G0002 [uncultured bacterium (gcode 4)]|uniref:Uncharacterized protein n=1 Tax=uncultured bacterium (gcode 4) TaxID=1234023 RepID=K1XVN5_9BACT|nr:MAG: hypothetical protein ACD_78C00452G0002 [uncultured bacterium (gcode 4)]
MVRKENAEFGLESSTHFTVTGISEKGIVSDISYIWSDIEPYLCVAKSLIQKLHDIHCSIELSFDSLSSLNSSIDTKLLKDAINILGNISNLSDAQRFELKETNGSCEFFDDSFTIELLVSVTCRSSYLLWCKTLFGSYPGKTVLEILIKTCDIKFHSISIIEFMPDRESELLHIWPLFEVDACSGFRHPIEHYEFRCDTRIRSLIRGLQDKTKIRFDIDFIRGNIILIWEAHITRLQDYSYRRLLSKISGKYFPISRENSGRDFYCWDFPSWGYVVESLWCWIFRSYYFGIHCGYPILYDYPCGVRIKSGNGCDIFQSREREIGDPVIICIYEWNDPRFIIGGQIEDCNRLTVCCSW